MRIRYRTSNEAFWILYFSLLLYDGLKFIEKEPITADEIVKMMDFAEWMLTMPYFSLPEGQAEAFMA